jgi:hypothetical protein
MKILDAILSLDPARKAELSARWHIATDPRKRISEDEQIARGLVLLPRWLDHRRLSEDAREVLRLLAAAPRGLPVHGLDEGLHALIHDGFVYRDPQRPTRCVLPSAFRLQLPASPSDSPRAVRLLFSSVPEEARRELCVHHLKRLPPWPWPMLLETPLERLEDPAWIKGELATLGDAERALLFAVDALGGEVSAAEVLELEREPARITQGSGVVVPRRSAIYVLARRGLVLAQPEGWLIPDEVERVVGSQRRARAAIDRQRLLMNRHLYDLTPARAELADSAGANAVALLAALSAAGHVPRDSRGVSRGAVRRAALDLHLDPDRAEFLVCLARSAGLWHDALPLHATSERLMRAWRRGGAWDEAAREPDLFRPGHAATAKATSLVREALLEVLLLMPEGEFALVSDVEAAAASDRRALSAQRALSRAAKSGQETIGDVPSVIKVLVERSLPWLGMIERGLVEQGSVARISRSARLALEVHTGEEARSKPPALRAEWAAPLRLICKAGADVAAIVEAGTYATVWLDHTDIGLAFDDDTLARGADHDPDLAGLRTALAVLETEIPSELEAAMGRATSHRPQLTLITSSAFVALDDAAVRDALFRDPEARGFWAAKPLEEGLLVAEGVDLSRVEELLIKRGLRLPQRIPQKS